MTALFPLAVIVSGFPGKQEHYPVAAVDLPDRRIPRSMALSPHTGPLTGPDSNKKYNQLFLL